MWHAEFTQPRQTRPSAGRSAPALKRKWAAAESMQTQRCTQTMMKMFTIVNQSCKWQAAAAAMVLLELQYWLVVQVFATHDT